MSAPLVVALTGCTRGLGRALTRYFVDEGAMVAGCGRNQREIERMRREFGGLHDFASVDVSDDDAVAIWAKRVADRLGAPHLLLNNAALIARNAPIWEVPREEADAVVRVNVNGTLNILRHFVPAMIASTAADSARPGVIVNFSSGWGRSTSPDVGIYCASKWAIEGLTKSLAQDLASSRVRVFALNPGIIDTGMLQDCFGESAGNYPKPERWVRDAGPFILSLLKRRSGHGNVAIEVPGVPLD
jgi:NAD(P)-dependent dehydrogenase (short-subunit alcohol dehydrogenase family)